MARELTVAAAQMGPVQRDDTREQVVERLRVMLAEAASRGADLVAFPELALTTFFPRWHMPLEDAEHWYERSMPNEVTQPLFDDAKRLGIGFGLGYALLTDDDRHVNVYSIFDKEGVVVGTYQKVHVPGHAEFEPWREFQHAERHYFEPGNDFPVWNAFGTIIGAAICNDRRWPETYRVMGLQGAELVLIGYNTPLRYAPDPTQDPLQAFHNHLSMQSGAYANGMFVIGVAKGGVEEGVPSLCDSAIYAPSGEILTKAETQGDEVIVATIDLDWSTRYRETVFNFDLYRVPEAYQRIAGQRGIIAPNEDQGAAS